MKMFIFLFLSLSQVALAASWKASGKIPDGVSVHYAWLGLDVRNEVKRGENRGKILLHDFIVLDFGNLGSYQSNKQYDLTLPSSTSEKPKALAVWLEKDGTPIVAAGSLLN